MCGREWWRGAAGDEGSAGEPCTPLLHRRRAPARSRPRAGAPRARARVRARPPPWLPPRSLRPGDRSAAPRRAGQHRAAPRRERRVPARRSKTRARRRSAGQLALGQVKSHPDVPAVGSDFAEPLPFFSRRPDELMRVDDTFLLQNAERDIAARAAQYGTFRKRFLFPFILPLAAMGLTMYSLCLLRCSRTRFSCLACSAGTIEAPRLVASSAR